MVGVAKVEGCGRGLWGGEGRGDGGDAEGPGGDDVSRGRAGETAWGHRGPCPHSANQSTGSWGARLHHLLRGGAPRSKTGQALVVVGASWAGGRGRCRRMRGADAARSTSEWRERMAVTAADHERIRFFSRCSWVARNIGRTGLGRSRPPCRG